MRTIFYIAPKFLALLSRYLQGADTKIYLKHKVII